MQIHDDNYFLEKGREITKRRDATDEKKLAEFEVKSKAFKKQLKEYFNIHPQYMPNTLKCEGFITRKL